MNRNTQRFHDRNHYLQPVIRGTLEDEADGLIRGGNFDDAYGLLKKAKKDTPKRHAMIDMKIVSLPYSELEFRLKNGLKLDDELMEDIEAVHGLVGEILEEQLDELEWQAQLSPSYERCLGSISETTILALGARHFNQTVDSIIVPASKDGDYAKRHACDLRLIDLKSNQETKLQVKTSRSNKDPDRYSKMVKIIAMQDIDPKNYRTPSARDSVARAIVDELSGTSDEWTAQKLDHATKKLFSVIANHKNY